MGVLALWTGLVLSLTGFRRLRAIARGQTSSESFRLGEPASLANEVSAANRNLMNLLEMPLLFYVVALSMYVTKQVTPTAIALSWAYVGLRVAHSIIHVTWNRVRHRFVVFAVSNFVLLALWIRFLVRVL